MNNVNQRILFGLTLILCLSCKPASKDYLSKNIGTLKYVPAGTFLRDKNPDNSSFVSAFWMSETEITREQFTAVTGLPDPSDVFYSSGPDDPVQMVTWYQAIIFCNKLSLLEGLTPVYSIGGATDPVVWIANNGGIVPVSGVKAWDNVEADWKADGYRLPTEMEWIWAAMGAKDGKTGYYKPFSGSTGKNDIRDYAWILENCGSDWKSRPVGTKKPNQLGIYDMSGNVLEWCWDWYRTILPAGTLKDYRGPISGPNRFMRGGGWYYKASVAAIAVREWDPWYQSAMIGFRVAKQ
jgi:formylglycine-generating enzyme required for sulfatase activity